MSTDSLSLHKPLHRGPLCEHESARTQRAAQHHCGHGQEVEIFERPTCQTSGGLGNSTSEAPLAALSLISSESQASIDPVLPAAPLLCPTPCRFAFIAMCSLLRTALPRLTIHAELASARDEEDFQRVQARLEEEWRAIFNLLVALAAIDATVFAISPDAIFKIRSYACLAVATSSVTSGLGITCALWFMLRYQWVDVPTFIIQSRDDYGSYIFFSLSSRVPAFCLFVSSVSLATFLCLVAYNAWPEGVLAMGIVVFFVICVQFLIYVVHPRIARLAVGYLRAVHTTQDAQGVTGADENV